MYYRQAKYYQIFLWGGEVVEDLTKNENFQTPFWNIKNWSSEKDFFLILNHYGLKFLYFFIGWFLIVLNIFSMFDKYWIKTEPLKITSI